MVEKAAQHGRHHPWENDWSPSPQKMQGHRLTAPSFSSCDMAVRINKQERKRDHDGD
jgi:hypothetical protein